MAEHVKDAPGYWMYEQSGVLIPVVQAYLHGQPMTLKQIATMRAYLRQWIEAQGFFGPEIEELRGRVNTAQLALIGTGLAYDYRASDSMTHCICARIT